MGKADPEYLHHIDDQLRRAITLIVETQAAHSLWPKKKIATRLLDFASHSGLNHLLGAQVSVGVARLTKLRALCETEDFRTAVQAQTAEHQREVRAAIATLDIALADARQQERLAHKGEISFRTRSRPTDLVRVTLNQPKKRQGDPDQLPLFGLLESSGSDEGGRWRTPTGAEPPEKYDQLYGERYFVIDGAEEGGGFDVQPITIRREGNDVLLEGEDWGIVAAINQDELNGYYRGFDGQKGIRFVGDVIRYGDLIHHILGQLVTADSSRLVIIACDENNAVKWYRRERAKRIDARSSHSNSVVVTTEEVTDHVSLTRKRASGTSARTSGFGQLADVVHLPRPDERPERTSASG